MMLARKYIAQQFSTMQNKHGYRLHHAQIHLLCNNDLKNEIYVNINFQKLNSDVRINLLKKSKKWLSNRTESNLNCFISF